MNVTIPSKHENSPGYSIEKTPEKDRNFKKANMAKTEADSMLFSEPPRSPYKMRFTPKRKIRSKHQSPINKMTQVFAQSVTLEGYMKEFIKDPLNSSKVLEMTEKLSLKESELCSKLSYLNPEEIALVNSDINIDYMQMDSSKQKQFVIGRIFFEICIGISYLHNNGWIHGDIKNDNIVVSSKNKGTTMIIDFNSIIYWWEYSDLHDLVGKTLAYAPPEAFGVFPCNFSNTKTNSDTYKGPF